MASGLLNYIRSRLLYKMVILYSLLTLIPLSIVSVAFYTRSQDLLERKSTEEAQQVLNRTSGQVDDLLSAYAQELYRFGKNKLLLAYLSEQAETGQSARKEAVEQLLRYNLMEASVSIGDYVDSLHLIDGEQTLSRIGNDKPLKFKKALDIMPEEYDNTPQWAYFIDMSRMVCRLKLSDPATGRPLGILVLALDASKLSALYEELELTQFYLVNEDNMIMSGINRAQIGVLLPKSSDAEAVTLTQESRHPGLKYTYIANAKPASIVRKLTTLSFSVTLIAWAGVILITYWLMRRITVPLTKLTRLMRRAGREEYVLMEEMRTRDEVAIVCHGYNQMVNRTRELIETSYKAELLKRDAELRAVQMYVNPHFLYNTLTYIHVLSATSEGIRHIPNVIKILATILRFSISPGGKMVTLANEMTIVEMYLQIHKYRYKDRLSFDIKLPRAFESIAVPKLLLQPLVENAIIHGIDRCEDGGEIRIKVEEYEFDLLITIVNSINHHEAVVGAKDKEPVRTGESKRGLGSGLNNVNERIKYQYGTSYGATLELHAGYATVTVRLPITLEGVE